MIDGVSHSDGHPLSFVRSVRTSNGSPTQPENNGSTQQPPAAAATADDSGVQRDYQLFDLALRQFSEILPQIELLDVPVE